MSTVNASQKDIFESYKKTFIWQKSSKRYNEGNAILRSLIAYKVSQIFNDKITIDI